HGQRRVHSFPTRRSSDLAEVGGEDRVRHLMRQDGIEHPLPGAIQLHIPAVGNAGIEEEAGLAAGPFVRTDATAIDGARLAPGWEDRKSTRLNSSHVAISY